MLTNRLHRRTASTRGGFTLVELLVVIGIIAILAGVALGPITNGIKQAKHNAALQTGRQIGQVCFSYATDNTVNGNAYPADKTAVAIAQDLMNANYVTDPSIFAVTSQAGINATPPKVSRYHDHLGQERCFVVLHLQCLDDDGGNYFQHV